MSVPNNLKYSKDHEWVQINDNIATVGITLHAAESLGDIVYVDVDSMDKELNQFVLNVLKAPEIVSTFSGVALSRTSSREVLGFSV